MNTEPVPSRFPTFRRFGCFILRCLRRLRRIFFSRRSLVVYIILFSLAWLALSIDRWHGRRAWAAEKEKLAAAGESLNIDEFLPPRPPDAENFFAIPELAEPAWPGKGPWLDISRQYTSRVHMWFRNQFIKVPGRYGGTKHIPANFPALSPTTPLKEWCDILRKTKVLPEQPLDPDPARELMLSAEQWRPFLDALYAAAKERPAAVFLPAPRERGGRTPMNTQTAGVSPLIRSLVLYSIVCHSTGDFRTPWSNLQVMQRLEEGYASEVDLFFGIMASGHALGMQKEVILSGIRRHGWTEAQLAQLAPHYDPKIAMERIRKAIGFERASVCSYLEKCEGNGVQFITADPAKITVFWRLEALHMNLFPEGPFLRRCALVSRTRSEALAALSGPVPAEGWAARILSLDRNTPSDPFGQWFGERAGHSVIRGLMAAQMITAGCALERHYLTHRRYPAALGEIASSLPAEPLMDSNGLPLRYRAAADGSTFCLWSVGRNGKDDGAAKGSDDVVFSTE